MGSSRLRLEISEQDSDVVASPNQIPDPNAQWRPSLPPRGQPQLPFDLPSASNLSPRAAQEGAQNESVIKPMPLPMRPGQHAPPTAEKPRPIQGSTTKKDARPKPYVLEVPAAAPRYPPNGHVDFFPWAGNHPEDQFSEPIIRGGYFDKAQMTQNETGSARASVFPSLKNKSGLQNLSSLFANVLAQRRSHGQVTASWAFKPPPRVTVTDTKREMWLKDLANPTISLKRLSRSIPHGIRGKVLLDQSLSKNIPIERAVWLAKCVGANELRSFRRKGVNGTFQMGGEAKWIRDFTVCVEQFVENIIGSCGEADFRMRVNYAIRLSAHFNAEYLLDREHYMDWLVSSLENSPQAKLPLWILITQIYWKDLLKYRKFGRRLAGALLGHLYEMANSPDHDILEPLLKRVQLLTKGLMTSSSNNFVYPALWAKCRDTIWSNLVSDDTQFLAIFEGIDRRNSRIADPGSERQQNSRQRLINLLDTTISVLPANNFTKQCWRIDEDKAMLLRTILEWSTSAYRPGSSKIYVGARLLRFWFKRGIDVTELILRFLDTEASTTGQNKAAFYHLVAELARSEHFSTARYLQWLISRGGFCDSASVENGGPLATRLLAELPLHNLSDSMISLRRTLLGRTDFSVDEERDRMRSCMAAINRKLPAMQANVDIDGFEMEHVSLRYDLPSLLSHFSRSSKSELGLWLRQKVRLQMQQPRIPLLEDWDTSAMKSGTSAISATDFHTVRDHLELIEDYSMLADVLKIVISSNDADVLASCADTLNLHIDTFAAIGALHNLFDMLAARLPILAEDQGSIPRGVLVSMSDLAARIPDRKLIADHLSQELAMSDRKNAADACSPVSDHMAVVQSAEVDFTDEIEKVLASGNSMEQATLDRLFQRVILQLEASWEKSPEQQRSCGLLLTRLRTFDSQHFDRLMINWMARFLKMPERPSMTQVLGPFISFGCLSFQAVFNSYDIEVGKHPDLARTMSARLSRDVLALVLGQPNLVESMCIEETYRFRIRQLHAREEFSGKVLSIIRESLAWPAHDNTHDAKDFLQSPSSWELLQEYAILHTKSMIDSLVLPLLRNSGASSADAITTLIDTLLVGDSPKATISIEAILNIADDLTLPFCQIKLESMFSGDDTAIADAEDGTSERLNVFDNAIEAAVAAGKTAWAGIVPLLDNPVAHHLRRRAQTQFLGLFPTPKSAQSCDSTDMQDHMAQAENLLRVIESTASGRLLPNSNQSCFATDIVTILSGIRILLSNSQDIQLKEALVQKWIPLLLHFVTMHTSEFDTTKAGNENRAKAILALSAIVLELQALDTNTEAVNELIEYSFDLALHLVDSLPDDVRQQCIRSLRDTASSPQLRYLFSFSANPSDWLMLSQKESITVTSGDGVETKGLEKEKISPFPLRRWELLGDSTPHFGENDTSLSLTLFGARRG